MRQILLLIAAIWLLASCSHNGCLSGIWTTQKPCEIVEPLSNKKVAKICNNESRLSDPVTGEIVICGGTHIGKPTDKEFEDRRNCVQAYMGQGYTY